MSLQIDTLALGNAVCEIGGGRTKADDLIDSAVGFSSKLKIGDKVDAGDVIGIVYCRSVTNSSSYPKRSGQLTSYLPKV